MQVVGTGLGDNSISCADFKVTVPTILVMGNEGSGIRANMRKCCDATIQIVPPITPQESATGDCAAHNRVDSLNVSVSTGIILHQMLSSITAK